MGVGDPKYGGVLKDCKACILPYPTETICIACFKCTDCCECEHDEEGNPLVEVTDGRYLQSYGNLAGRSRSQV